ATRAVLAGAPSSWRTPSATPPAASVPPTRSPGPISRYSPWNPTSVPSPVTITCRQRPPTRRSISTTVTSPRFACHQRATSSGVVQARHTRSRGASNSLVIRICLSVGSVSMAVPSVVILAISFLLLGELAEHGIKPLEPLLPQLPLAPHP